MCVKATDIPVIFFEANKGKVADWSWPWVCGGCTTPRYSQILAAQ